MDVRDVRLAWIDHDTGTLHLKFTLVCDRPAQDNSLYGQDYLDQRHVTLASRG